MSFGKVTMRLLKDITRRIHFIQSPPLHLSKITLSHCLKRLIQKQYDYKCENGPRNEYSANHDGYGTGAFLVEPKGKIALRQEELCRP